MLTGPVVPSLFSFISWRVVFGTTKSTFFSINTCGGTKRRMKRERQKLKKDKEKTPACIITNQCKSQQQAKTPNHDGYMSDLPALSSFHIHIDNHTTRMLLRLIMNPSYFIILFHSLCVPLGSRGWVINILFCFFLLNHNLKALILVDDLCPFSRIHWCTLIHVQSSPIQSMVLGLSISPNII